MNSLLFLGNDKTCFNYSVRLCSSIYKTWTLPGFLLTLPPWCRSLILQSTDRFLLQPPLRLLQLPGVVASSCNPATGRQVLRDDLRRGVLVVTGSCWSGVRTKACINMGPPGEPGGARLTKEGRTGPGGKLSSQESPCESVVGPRQWVLSGHQPLQYSQTQNFLPSILFEMIQS